MSRDLPWPVLAAGCLALAAPAAHGAADLTAEQGAAFRSAKTIRLVVEDAYTGKVGSVSGVSLPFAALTRRLFAAAGLKDAAADGAPGLAVRIRAEGQAEGREFRDIFGQGPAFTRYTVATVRGEISLSGPDGASYSRSFYGAYTVGDLLLEQKGASSYRDESSAPFAEAFEADGYDSFVETMVELVRDLYGPAPLIAASKDESVALRRHVSVALGSTHDPAAVDALVAALHDSEPTVRAAAAGALGVVGDARGIEPLVAALNDEERAVGVAAGGALGSIPDPLATQAAVAALRTASERRTRLYAALALKRRADPTTLEALTAALEDADSDVRRVALEALSALHDPRAVEVFMRLTKHDDWRVREEAFRALFLIEDPRAFDPLLDGARDSAAEVRRTVLYLLGQRKDVRAVPALIAALSDADWSTRQAASAALATITGQSFGDDVKKWQRWWKRQEGRPPAPLSRPDRGGSSP